MENLTALRGRVHRRTLKNRSVEAIVESTRFERLWLESSEEQQKEVGKLVIDESKLALILWMQNHPSLDLGERPMTYLRNRGRGLRVKNYSRLSKPELIREIQIKEQDYEQKQDGDVDRDT